MLHELQYDEEKIKHINNFKIECRILLQLIETIKNNDKKESFDTTKNMIINALECGIGAMICVDDMIRKQDDLK